MAIEMQEYRNFRGTFLEIKLENEDEASMRKRLLSYSHNNYISHKLEVKLGAKVVSNPKYEYLRKTVALLNRTANKTAARDLVITINEK